MITSTFMIGFSTLVMYTLAIGFCIAVLRGEWLTKGCIRFYRGLIAVNLIAIAVFIEKCFTVEKTSREEQLLIFASITFLVFIIETVLIVVVPMKGDHKTSKTVPRETFDLKEENFETEENIKICCTQMKKESSFKGIIVFMQPDYYKADLNGKVWFHKKNKKEYLGHTGKYDEISDFFVRAGYHTIRYDHSNNREPISIETVLKRVRIILDERNEANVVVFCAGNINEFINEIYEILKPSELICMGAANQEILENIFKVKEHVPVFIGDFGDDPYCNVKNENAVHFENTDFTFCVRGKRKLKKYGRSADNEGITDVSALGVIEEWLTEQEKAGLEQPR